MAFKGSVFIDAPVETVFAITTDFNQAPMIMENVIRTEMLTDGPMQVGTQVKEVRKMGGKEAETVLIVSEFVPNEKYAVTSENSGIRVEYKYEFTAKETGTAVDFNGIIHTTGLKSKLLKPLVEMILKKEDKDHLIRLKQYIEQQKNS